MGWIHLTPLRYFVGRDHGNPDNSGNDFIRGVPIVGNMVQTVAGDSNKRRIKMRLRRISVVLAGGAVPVSAVTGAAAVIGASAMAGGAAALANSWESIDSWIDSLSDNDANLLENFFDATSPFNSI